jgi:serine/threonine protein kinase
MALYADVEDHDMTDPTSDRILEMELFAEALDLPEQDRGALIHARCGHNSTLRERMMALLLADNEASEQEFFHVDDDSQLGKSIGPYHILQKLGDGGMGTVYLAEQAAPVRRRVAVKVIRQGMESRSVVARFESERQALALMDDTGIARVFDAGNTDQGQPYFVMEYVPGEPITEYCDKHRLDIRHRLELCVKVCRAVQHAHQRGVIHRDLKPTNILITAIDSEPMPKVIDFGVAKAIGQKLTDKTLFTGHGQMIGTPGYMSPEQAEMSTLEIDTRTDIYSLGVLLYELLTGRLPIDTTKAMSLGIGGIQSALRETEILMPSAQLSSGGGELGRISELRSTDPQSLQRRIRGDIDWMIMRAMHRDRTMRYASASELAEDIGRYLRMEPVMAAPPSAAYSISRLISRNQRFLVAIGAATIVTAIILFALGQVRLAPIIALIAVIVALVSGLGIALFSLARAGIERDRALAAERRAKDSMTLAQEQRANAEHQAEIRQEVSRFLNEDILASASPEVRGRETTVVDAIDAASVVINDRFSDAPLVEAAVRQTIGRTYMSLGSYDSAHPHVVRALAIYREQLGPDHADTLATLDDLASLTYELGDDDESESFTRESIDRRHMPIGQTSDEMIASMNHLAIICTRQERYEEAESLHLETYKICLTVRGPDDESTLTSLNNLASWYYRRGRFEEAVVRHAETLEARQRVLGELHPHTLISSSNLGGTLCRLGRFIEAKPHLEHAVTAGLEVLGPDHPHLAAFRRYLGECLIGLEDYELAKQCLEQALDVCIPQLGAEHQRSMEIQQLLSKIIP